MISHAMAIQHMFVAWVHAQLLGRGTGATDGTNRVGTLKLAASSTTTAHVATGILVSSKSKARAIGLARSPSVTNPRNKTTQFTVHRKHATEISQRCFRP